MEAGPPCLGDNRTMACLTGTMGDYRCPASPRRAAGSICRREQEGANRAPNRVRPEGRAPGFYRLALRRTCRRTLRIALRGEPSCGFGFPSLVEGGPRSTNRSANHWFGPASLAAMLVVRSVVPEPPRAIAQQDAAPALGAPPLPLGRRALLMGNIEIRLDLVIGLPDLDHQSSSSPAQSPSWSSGLWQLRVRLGAPISFRHRL